MGLGFLHREGRYRPVGSPFSSPGYWICKYLEGFLIRGWEIFLPGCGGTSTLARGATLAARWLHEPQPIITQPVGVGFPHRAGRYRPGESLFSSLGCRNCKCMAIFLIRRRHPILPGVRWLYIRTPANQRSAGGAGFSTPCGAVSTRGNSVFVPRLSELYMR